MTKPTGRGHPLMPAPGTNSDDTPKSTRRVSRVRQFDQSDLMFRQLLACFAFLLDL